MPEPDIEAIRARYQRALDAKPSKGDYTPAGIDAITDSVCDIPDLLAQNRRYANRIANLSRAVQAVIDEHVTPRAQSLEAIHVLARMISDRYGDDWPHNGGCQGDGALGCPLCQILARSRQEGLL